MTSLEVRFTQIGDSVEYRVLVKTFSGATDEEKRAAHDYGMAISKFIESRDRAEIIKSCKEIKH